MATRSSCRVTATTAAGATGAVSNALAVPAPPPPCRRRWHGPWSSRRRHRRRRLPRRRRAPPLDRTAPAATLSGATRQKLGPTVAVKIACPDEACRATSSATVRVPRLGRTKAKTYLRGGAHDAARPRRPGDVTLTLSRTARRAIARALRARQRIVVTISVGWPTAPATRRTLTRRITLRR